MSVVYTEITLKNMWKNRHLVCEALVMPDAPEVLLGALALEHMDLTVNPLTARRVTLRVSYQPSYCGSLKFLSPIC